MGLSYNINNWLSRLECEKEFHGETGRAGTLKLTAESRDDFRILTKIVYNRDVVGRVGYVSENCLRR